MSLMWLFNLPTWLFCIGTMGVSVAFSVGGLIASRPLVHRWLGESHASNEMVSYFLSAIGVFYGITLGLIAVGVWETYSSVGDAASREAASIAALYRDVSALSEPHSTELRESLRSYTRHVIDDAWPMQRRGEIPHGGTVHISAFSNSLTNFEPGSIREQTVQAEAFRQLNNLIELRRRRVEAEFAGMPLMLWMVVLIGAVLNVVTTWLFVVPRLGLHIALVAIMSALIGLLIYMMAAMDHPYLGDMSITSEAYEIVYNDLMISET
ncbi:MAG: DUF4239 domain-containing protein [Phycisphaeraceae bacterium]|nr:DUF4239 domain-containing protein [Phycisphaeraceae bacterium]